MGITSIDFAAEREAMVERQLRRRAICEPEILDAFRAVPRELFVGRDVVRRAYGDHPLPIGAGQTISQPYIIALMIQAASIGASDQVLEIGAGSGYAAAVMSRIAARVIGIERQHDLIDTARERLRRLGFDNVEIFEGDGSLGWPDHAPYDAILAAACGRHVPTCLVEQLAPAGRLVMPIGEPSMIQKLVRVAKRDDGSLLHSDLGMVRFVPLIGKQGWSEC